MVTWLIFVLLDFTSEHPKWFQMYCSDVKLEYCSGDLGCSLLFFLHWQSWYEKSLTAFTSLQPLILTSWGFLFKQDYFIDSVHTAVHKQFCPSRVDERIKSELLLRWLWNDPYTLMGYIYTEVQDSAPTKPCLGQFWTVLDLIISKLLCKIYT